MKKDDYLKRLSEALKEYGLIDRWQYLAEYENKINELISNNANNNNIIVETLGYPEALAKDIIKDREDKNYE